MFSNQQVAAVFENIADTMELLGEDRFKYQAYRRASETLRDLPRSLQDYHARGALKEIPGVGSAISSKIDELLTTGSLQFYERLRARVPDGVLDVMRTPGVGPKTAWRLYQELGITSLEALAAAAGSGRIRALKGLGTKLEARIIAGLEQRPAGPERFLLGDALPLARELIDAFRAASRTLRDISYAGSLRRAAPTIGDLNFVALAEDVPSAVRAFVALPHVASVERQEDGYAHVRLHNGKRCSLSVARLEGWGAALVMATGSATHCERLTRLAAERGLALTPMGLRRGAEPVAVPDEAALYAALDLPFIAPELREDWGEIEAARAGTLPSLVELADIRGDLHMHTNWSDGHATLVEMVEAARGRGYGYSAITDHGFYMGMVNGLDAARLKAQRAEIDAVNAELSRRGIDFRLLQGIEVDILPDGTLALADDVLAALDWVVASPHVSLRQDRAAATARLIKAIRNPHVDCIGHPTGRILLRREGSDLDMAAVLEAAAEMGTVLEVDGAYPRLDLDAEHVKPALALGIKIAIDSDAHATGELNSIDYGVRTARRGWATAADVVNTWSWDEVEAYKARRAP